MNFSRPRPKEKSSTPQVGDTKKVKRFAFYKQVNDTLVILGYYYQIWTYHSMAVRPWQITGLEVIPHEQN